MKVLIVTLLALLLALTLIGCGGAPADSPEPSKAKAARAVPRVVASLVTTASEDSTHFYGTYQRTESISNEFRKTVITLGRIDRIAPAAELRTWFSEMHPEYDFPFWASGRVFLLSGGAWERWVPGKMRENGHIIRHPAVAFEMETTILNYFDSEIEHTFDWFTKPVPPPAI